MTDQNPTDDMRDVFNTLLMSLATLVKTITEYLPEPDDLDLDSMTPEERVRLKGVLATMLSGYLGVGIIANLNDDWLTDKTKESIRLLLGWDKSARSMQEILATRPMTDGVQASWRASIDALREEGERDHFSLDDAEEA